MKKILTLALLSAVASSGAIATSANAAMPILDSSNILIGANGVKVGKNTFNVEFKAGTCAQVYGTCTKTSFDFYTQQDALEASQALLDQVFIDGQSGRFDSNPRLIFGCQSGGSLCLSSIVYGAFTDSLFLVTTASNSAEGDVATGGSMAVSLNTATTGNRNFARFTFVPDSVTSAVPEPASWVMMIGGFGMVGASMRRRKTRVAFA